MLRLVEDEHERGALIAAGRERARSFSPVEAARRQVEVYRLALASPRRAAS
jgi:hypothetical protein